MTEEKIDWRAGHLIKYRLLRPQNLEFADGVIYNKMPDAMTALDQSYR